MVGVAQREGDESVAVEFSASVVDLFLFGALLLLFNTVCIFAVISYFSNEDAFVFRREFGVVVAVFALPFLIIFSAMWLFATILLRGVIVHIGPGGLIDRRISEDLIPWSAILGVSQRSFGGYTEFRLSLDQKFESNLRRTLLARIFLKDRFYGGYRLFALGIKATNRDLREALSRYRTVVRI